MDKHAKLSDQIGEFQSLSAPDQRNHPARFQLPGCATEQAARWDRERERLVQAVEARQLELIAAVQADTIEKLLLYVRVEIFWQSALYDSETRLDVLAEHMRQTHRRARSLGITGLPPLPTAKQMARAEAEAFLLDVQQAIEAGATSASDASLTVRQIAGTYDVDAGTVRRWCQKNEGPHVRKDNDGWRVAPTAMAATGWPKRHATNRRLAAAVKWECANCAYEVTRDTNPGKCSKCGRSAFTRQTHR